MEVMKSLKQTSKLNSYSRCNFKKINFNDIDFSISEDSEIKTKTFLTWHCCEQYQT